MQKNKIRLYIKNLTCRSRTYASAVKWAEQTLQFCSLGRSFFKRFNLLSHSFLLFLSVTGFGKWCQLRFLFFFEVLLHPTARQDTIMQQNKSSKLPPRRVCQHWRHRKVVTWPNSIWRIICLFLLKFKRLFPWLKENLNQMTYIFWNLRKVTFIEDQLQNKCGSPLRDEKHKQTWKMLRGIKSIKVPLLRNRNHT